MIKNDHRIREFNREQQKIHYAHYLDCSDHVPRGKYLKSHLKYPKQDLSEELDDNNSFDQLSELLQNV